MHRMSNSNANLKHIIKNYNQGETQQQINLPSQVIQSNNAHKRNTSSKMSKKSSLNTTSQHANISGQLPAAHQELVGPHSVAESSGDQGFADYNQVYSSKTNTGSNTAGM